MRTDTLAVPQVSLASRPAGTTEIRAGLVLLVLLAAAAWLGPWLLHISPFERSLDLLPRRQPATGSGPMKKVVMSWPRSCMAVDWRWWWGQA